MRRVGAQLTARQDFGQAWLRFAAADLEVVVGAIDPAAPLVAVGIHVDRAQIVRAVHLHPRLQPGGAAAVELDQGRRQDAIDAFLVQDLDRLLTTRRFRRGGRCRRNDREPTVSSSATAINPS